jgi:hypothetical protein
MLQISSAESAWVNEQSQKRAQVTLVAQVNRRIVQAFNVTAEIAGRDRTLKPLVFMAPRSGWWHCASEQGSRLVCWLEVMRVLAAAKPRRDCLFVALSGHELALLGMNPYLGRRPGLIKRAQAWVFFGSDIGAPRQPNLIHASDDALEQWIVTALKKESIAVDARSSTAPSLVARPAPCSLAAGDLSHWRVLVTFITTWPTAGRRHSMSHY